MQILYHDSMRHLGVDYGSSRVGLALSDEAGTMGFPHSIIPNTPDLKDKLCALILEQKVGTIVIGESRDFMGADNPIAKEARALGNALAERLRIPVEYESETFTTAEARRAYEPNAKTRSPKKRPPVDSSAAALILTSYLSRKS